MERSNVYKCSVCGNEVELLIVGGGTLVCCGQPMNLLEPKTLDEGLEKHVPIIEKSENGYRVKVGDVEHPMTEDHYIRWIELHTKECVFRKELFPLDKPEADFCCSNGNCDNVWARIECNLHEVWKSK